jgi:hypothetical protein
VLKSWGVKWAKRVGNKKVLVAVARKLAIIMHRMWLSGSAFQHGGPAIAALRKRPPRSVISSAEDVG